MCSVTLPEFSVEAYSVKCPQLLFSRDTSSKNNRTVDDCAADEREDKATNEHEGP